MGPVGGWRSLCVGRRARGTQDAESRKQREDFGKVGLADRPVGRGRESENDI